MVVLFGTARCLLVHLTAGGAAVDGFDRDVLIAMSPIGADGEVVGAIELGFLEPLVTADLELLLLLLLLGDSIGSALRTARLRSEREELRRAHLSEGRLPSTP